jgi:hypothetical protein
MGKQLFEKLKNWLAESFWSYTGTVFWTAVVASVMAGVAIIVVVLCDLPIRWVYAVCGFFVASLFILTVATIIVWFQHRFYRKHGLSAIQKQMIRAIGIVSDWRIKTRDLWVELKFDSEHLEPFHREWRGLLRYKLLTYSNGWLELTQNGRDLYDKLIDEDDDDFTPPTPDR